MMITGSIRRLSTRVVIDKLVGISQLASPSEKQLKFQNFMKKYFQQEEEITPNFVNDVMQYWANEQPTKYALWSCQSNSNESQKMSFNDLYKQSSRIANALTGKAFNLTPGKTVLVILPDSASERKLIQLACLQSGLIYSSYDPKDLMNLNLPQRIAKLTIDCIITNTDCLELVRKYTHNPIRPLIKGLITQSSRSEPLPVGWTHLMQSADDAPSTYTKVNQIHQDTPVIRSLSHDNQVIQYSSKSFNQQFILSAFWLNLYKTGQLTWMQDSNEILSIAPWLFGSSIFSKDTTNFQTTLKTFENNPIDTYCTASTNYQMIENSKERKPQTHLKQLFSTETIESSIKSHWYSLTNLHIHDDYADIENKLTSNAIEQKTSEDREELSFDSKTIPLEKFIFQYRLGASQIHNQLSRL